MTTLDTLREEITSFLDRHAMTPTEFSRAAGRDPNFHRKLFSKKHDFTTSKVDEVRAFMRAKDSEAEEPAGGEGGVSSSMPNKKCDLTPQNMTASAEGG